MILAIVGRGSLGASIVRALEGAGHSVKRPADAAPTSDGTEPDLFADSTGCRTIVYAPAPTLLEASLNPRPSAERIKDVVAAAHAPAVELVVCVLPQGDGFEEEVKILRRSGKPYVVLRSAPLLEEIADAAGLDHTKSVSVPRDKRTRIASSAAFADCLCRAVDDEELQGRTIEVEADEVELAEMMLRAAAATGRTLQVTRSSPTGLKIRRVFARIFRLPQRAAHALCKRFEAASA